MWCGRVFPVQVGVRWLPPLRHAFGTTCVCWGVFVCSHSRARQIIVCENGSAGVNFEHSHLDGHTVLRFASDVFTDTILYVVLGPSFLTQWCSLAIIAPYRFHWRFKRLCGGSYVRRCSASCDCLEARFLL
jgi:hypothetical protein